MVMNLLRFNNSLLISTKSISFFLPQHHHPHHHHKSMSMSLLHHHRRRCRLPLSSFPNQNPELSNLSRKALSTPARDRIITFGKHRGKMLGTLPSDYLIWMSKNLLSSDSLHWAELAEEVLADPVYKDRLEWESAERLLTGNNPNTLRLSFNSAVSELLDITEKFGWDNEDKAGWARVDFALLGTSKGGRIPRQNTQKSTGESNGNGEGRERKGADEGLVSGKRRERRERRRGGLKEEQEEGMWEFERRKMLSNNGDDANLEPNSNLNSNLHHNRNPFPGRESLFEKMRQRRRERGVAD